jgi:hypothetical protein
MSSSEQTKDPGVLKSMGIAIAVIFSVLTGLIIIFVILFRQFGLVSQRTAKSLCHRIVMTAHAP